ncbi:hypothetical protein BVRB_034190, partial [Beta vulgaris subsp. vulgaris]
AEPRSDQCETAANSHHPLGDSCHRHLAHPASSPVPPIIEILAEHYYPICSACDIIRIVLRLCLIALYRLQQDETADRYVSRESEILGHGKLENVPRIDQNDFLAAERKIRIRLGRRARSAMDHDRLDLHRNPDWVPELFNSVE